MQPVDFLNLQNIFYKIYTITDYISTEGIKSFMLDYWPTITFFSLAVSFFLVVFDIYYYRKLEEVKELDAKVFDTVFIPSEEVASVKNERWLAVLKHLDTDSQAEWKAAILEADIILDEMTVKMGYHGENLGERLKGVEKSDFLTIDQAWEAHKVRNIIAHQGSDYILTKREAKRVIDLYRQVFEEFKFI